MNRIKLVAAIAIALTISACTTQQMEIDNHWTAYNVAMDNADINSAIAEVNAVLAFDTTDQAVIDTLSRLYFIMGNSFGAYKLAGKLEDKSNDHKVILAESAMQLGHSEDAKKYFLELNKIDSTGENISNKYKLATLHFNDEEFKEAIQLLGEITKNENSSKQATRVNMENGAFQDVSLYAASWNFAGFIQSLVQDFDTAEEYYDEAIRAQPNFILAKNNKERLAAQREAAAKEGQ